MFIHRELQHLGREMSCSECGLIGLLKQLDYIYFDVQPHTCKLMLIVRCDYSGQSFGN